MTNSHSPPPTKCGVKRSSAGFSTHEEEPQIAAGGAGSSESSSETSATKASTKTSPK